MIGFLLFLKTKLSRWWEKAGNFVDLIFRFDSKIKPIWNEKTLAGQISLSFLLADSYPFLLFLSKKWILCKFKLDKTSFFSKKDFLIFFCTFEKIILYLERNSYLDRFDKSFCSKSKKENSPTGTWTRVSRVRVWYPNQLDY